MTSEFEQKRAQINVLLSALERDIKQNMAALIAAKQSKYNVPNSSFASFHQSQVDNAIHLIRKRLSYANVQKTKLRKQRKQIAEIIEMQNAPAFSLPVVDFSNFSPDELVTASNILLKVQEMLTTGRERYICSAIVTAEFYVYSKLVTRTSRKLTRAIDQALNANLNNPDNYTFLKDMIYSYGLSGMITANHPKFRELVLPKLAEARQKRKRLGIDVIGEATSSMGRVNAYLAADLFRHDPDFATCTLPNMKHVSLTLGADTTGADDVVHMVSTKANEGFVHTPDFLSTKIRKIWVNQMLSEISKRSRKAEMLHGDVFPAQ